MSRLGVLVVVQRANEAEHALLAYRGTPRFEYRLIDFNIQWLPPRIDHCCALCIHSLPPLHKYESFSRRATSTNAITQVPLVGEEELSQTRMKTVANYGYICVRVTQLGTRGIAVRVVDADRASVPSTAAM